MIERLLENAKNRVQEGCAGRPFIGIGLSASDRSGISQIGGCSCFVLKIVILAMDKKRVTLIDVANAAGVSRATASLVLRGSKPVAEQTRA